MPNEYEALSTISADDYKSRISQCFDKTNAVKSDAEDLRKIENLLEAREGLFSSETFFVSRGECTNCHRTFTFYDHVYGAVKDAGHSKSLVLHTLIGKKYFIQSPRPVRCSNCDTVSVGLLNYETPRYGCCN